MTNRERRARVIFCSDYFDANSDYVDTIFNATEHHGDCTNEPHTCHVCLKNECLELADAIEQSDAEAGMVTVPKEPTEAEIRQRAGGGE